MSVFAQDYPGRLEDLAASRASKALKIADLRPQLFNELSPTEAQVYRDIVFDVSLEDKIINTSAYRRNGVRRVAVTEAMGRAIELNVDAFLMEQSAHLPDFLGRYMDYVSSRYAVNAKRDLSLPPLRIASPYDMAKWSDADLRQFYADSQINRTRAGLLGGAYAFVLAHEVAHHVFGHVDHQSHERAEIRAQEAQADAWAIDLLTKKHTSPLGGMIPLLFSYYAGQHSVATEGDSDHPADEQRILAMFEGLERRLPQFQASIRESGQTYEAVHAQVTTAIGLIKSEIAATKR